MARNKAAERKAMSEAYEEVSDRDGYCRLYHLDETERREVWRLFGQCNGKSEAAHVGDSRRFKTRGLPPKVRHNKFGIIKLCDRHHDDYDQHRLDIEELTDQRAEGPLRFRRGDDVYEEQAC